MINFFLFLFKNVAKKDTTTRNSMQNVQNAQPVTFVVLSSYLIICFIDSEGFSYI